MPGRSLRAWAWDIDDQVVAVAGHYIDASGQVLMFSDMKEKAPAIRIWREAKALMAQMKMPMVCMAQEGSGPFLERLGWVRMNDEVYLWQH